MRGVLVSMDNELRDYIVNLNALSKDVFGEECRISFILKSTNFSQEQIVYLQGEGLHDLMQNIDFALRVFLTAYSSTIKNYEILYMRYGLFGCKKQTLEYIGRQYGVTRERVRQIQVKTLKTLSKNRFQKLIIIAACQTLKIGASEMLDGKIRTILADPLPDYGMSGADRRKEEALSMSLQTLINYAPSDIPLSISEFIRRIDNLKADNIISIKYRTVINFLINAELLEEYINTEGKVRKRPTESGMRIGIFTEERNGSNGPYTIILYNKEAQKYLIENMENILTAEQEAVC